MTYPILTDADVAQKLTMPFAVDVMEQAFRQRAAGTLVAPGRISCDLEVGQLVFTAGASSEKPPIVGFRVYDLKQLSSPHRDELNVVFDANNGALRGLVIGPQLGAIRTGAIGGVAVKHLANPDAKILGLIGTGFQARTQLEAALVVRNFETIRVYSRSTENRSRFAEEMSVKIGREIIAVESARAVVEDTDVLICTTKSATPVIEAIWLKPGVHINNVGPKFSDSHELGLDVAQRAHLLLTDAPAQLESFGDRFILAGTPLANSVVDLAEIVAGKSTGRTSPDDITLFYSLGLAGTEVLLADRLFDKFNTNTD